ncbi:MAG: hypothetical protein M1476_02990, partial [Candidatus Thermoplasmatota archaeon]|nr:hypothetical protein [Candidatus Thermoplasmatota archaeon]
MASKFQKTSVLKIGNKEYNYFSLKSLERDGYNLSRLPASLRIILESLVRNVDGNEVQDKDIENLIGWNSKNPGDDE